MFQRFVFSLILTLSVFFVAIPVHAALTNDQIASVLSLLSSFGVEPATVLEVEAILRGTVLCPNLSESLSRGSTDATTSGAVSSLQRFLGVEPVSGYFGPITEKAVQDFQIKNGIISSGTPETTGFGVVGPKTRAKIAEVCKAFNEKKDADTSQSQTTQTETAVTSTIPQTPSVTSSSQSFNDLIYAEAATTGISANQLAYVNELLASMPTTTPAAAQASISSGSSAPSSGASDIASLLAPFIEGALSNVFGGSSGGGFGDKNFGTPKVLSLLECTCSNTVLITMQPVDPDNVKALTYTRGTQQYENFNIPVIEQALVGKYNQFGVCYIYSGNSCTSVQNDGMITTTVGSSL